MSLKFSQFSGAGVSPEKKGEYSVKFNGIFLTAVTASVDAVSVQCTWPRVGARRSVPWPARGGACVVQNFF